MLAVSCTSFSVSDPVSGLWVGERPSSEPHEGWTTVSVKAAALNHHDLWSLRGVGLSADRLPMVLGCDAAGIDEGGNEVIIHAVVASEGWRGDETLDPRRSLLSEKYDGVFSEQVVVPRWNLVPKPKSMAWETAAVLPTAWLTAYRMLAANADVRPGQLVLVQGAGGGVATACIQLGTAMGLRVWTTSRSSAKRAGAVTLGAEAAFEPGARLPEKVDAVIETVGAATWSHSVNVLRPGGTIVTCGATSGGAPHNAELNKIFFRQLRVIGSTMGSRDELAALARFVEKSGIQPLVADVLPLSQAARGFTRMLEGDVFGKVVFTL